MPPQRCSSKNEIRPGQTHTAAGLLRLLVWTKLPWLTIPNLSESHWPFSGCEPVFHPDGFGFSHKNRGWDDLLLTGLRHHVHNTAQFYYTMTPAQEWTRNFHWKIQLPPTPLRPLGSVCGELKNSHSMGLWQQVLPHKQQVN